MHLVRQAARRHNGDLEVFGIAFDGATQRLAQLVAAAARWHGKLQHPHLQRHDLQRPALLCLVAHHGQRREAAMVQCLVLEKGHIELFAHQRLANMACQRTVATDGRQIACAAAFIGHFVFFAHAQRKRRVVVEKE